VLLLSPSPEPDRGTCLMSFGTTGTRLAGHGEKKGGGSTMRQPTWPKDPGQEAYYRGSLKDI
jgi:hypothetical protein